MSDQPKFPATATCEVHGLEMPYLFANEAKSYASTGSGSATSWCVFYECSKCAAEGLPAPGPYARGKRGFVIDVPPA